MTQVNEKCVTMMKAGAKRTGTVIVWECGMEVILDIRDKFIWYIYFWRVLYEKLHHIIAVNAFIGYEK